jgi:hypothetical protein
LSSPHDFTCLSEGENELSPKCNLDAMIGCKLIKIRNLAMDKEIGVAEGGRPGRRGVPTLLASYARTVSNAGSV